ncbi:zinc finger protein 91-like [Lytechinus variegatus]|uniref:zinc finger protein 91-like n=1 Tax=Lytechinus variegatus TaxID=7654 RepID=UPI001BB266E0|nr:zinc finger protein 91-like [Lytechinus variegatus]
MESPSPMWDFVSPEDNKEMIDKFRTESKKVMDRWSLGNASTTEKDAAVSFLVQLGAVRISFQSGSSHIQSERRVSVQFEDRPLLETKHDGPDTADPLPMKNEDIDSREQSGALTSASQASSSKDVPIDSGDDGDNENCSAWMSEPSDDDDDTVTAQEDDRSATQQPSEEHPCPNCHAILHSTWELDLHKVNDCEKDPIKYVYNCDQCTKSFLRKLKLISHLRIDHKMTPHDVIVKLKELESTKIQKGLEIEVSKKEPHRRQGLKESNGERKRQKVSGRKKEGEGSVQKAKRTRSDKAVAPPKLKRLCVRLKKIKMDDRDEYSSSSRQTRSSETAVVSNVEIAPQNCSSNDHQILEALDAKYDCERRAIEEVDENEIVREEKTECKDNERPTVLSESEFSEARSLEENGNSLVNFQSSDDKGFTDENVDTPSSPTNENRKGEVLTDSIVADIPEVMFEPCEESDQKNVKIKRGRKVCDQNTCNSTISSKSESKESIFGCLLCDMEFQKAYQYHKHMFDCHKESRHQEFTCGTCDKMFLKKSLYTTHIKTHMDRNKRQKYHCKECNKSFLSKYDHNFHMDWHAEKFKCEMCGKLLSSRYTLESHIKCVHNKLKYPCHLCEKVFANEKYLKLHIEDHELGRKYKCEECGGTFIRPHQLKSHKELVHSGACQCLCELCGETFKTPQILKQHTDTVHSLVYKYSCDVCGKKFQRTSNLNRHKKLHFNDPMLRRFPCTLCDKRFRDQSKLNVHMDWHNNIRSHTCDICEKSFLTKGNLTKHMLTHQDKKPHECEICSVGFMNLPQLRKHLKVKHKVILKTMKTKLVEDEHLVNKSAAGPLLPSESRSTDNASDSPVHHQEHLTNDSVYQVSEVSIYQDPEPSVSESVGELLLGMMTL